MNDKTWIQYIEYTCGSLSIGASLIVISLFLFYRKIRSFAFEQIIYLITACMINTASYMINYIPKDNVIQINKMRCYIQAFLMVWFEISQMLWCSIIAYYLYDNVINFDYQVDEKRTDDDEESHKKKRRRQRIKLLFIGFVLPIIMPILGICFRLFGASGRYCWVITSVDSTWGRVYGGLIYTIVYMLLIFNIMITCFVVRFLYKIKNHDNKEAISRYIWLLVRYPLIQIICVLPITINRIVFFINGSYSTPIEVTALLFNSIQGLAYSIGYGYTDKVKSTLLECLDKVFCCNKYKKKAILDINNAHSSSMSTESYSYRQSFIDDLSMDRRTNYLNE